MKFEAWDTDSANRIAAFETRAELLRWLVDLGADQGSAALQDVMVGEPDTDYSVEAIAWCLGELALPIARFVARSRTSMEPWQPQGRHRRSWPGFRLETAAKVIQQLPGAAPAPAFG